MACGKQTNGQTDIAYTALCVAYRAVKQIANQSRGVYRNFCLGIPNSGCLGWIEVRPVLESRGKQGSSQHLNAFSSDLWKAHRSLSSWLGESCAAEWSFNHFFTARRSYASAVLGVVFCPSVCLSVCLSVTRVLCD